MLGEQHIVLAVSNAEEKLNSMTGDEIYKAQMKEGITLLEKELMKIYYEKMEE